MAVIKKIKELRFQYVTYKGVVKSRTPTSSCDLLLTHTKVAIGVKILS